MNAKLIEELQKLAQQFTFPFVLEQDNEEGVVVNDCLGYAVFSSWHRDSHPDSVKRARAVAWFLLGVSGSSLTPSPSTEQPPVGVTHRKAFICKGCEGVYAELPPTQCDCTVGPNQPGFYEGVIAYPATVPTGEQDKLAFLKSKGLTVGMLKDGHGERLAYVCEPGSEFDDAVHINKLVDAELERDKWKDVAQELRALLERYDSDCGLLHHKKDEFHKDQEPCPIISRIQDAIARFDSLTQAGKGGQEG